jgi:subtilisin family serine protease
VPRPRDARRQPSAVGPVNRFLPLLLGAVVSGTVLPARADVPVRAMLRAFDDMASSAAPGTGSTRQALGTLPVVVRFAPETPVSPAAGVLPIAPGFAVVQASPDALRSLEAAHPDWALTWAPPRRWLLDQAVPATGAVTVRNETGLTGRGVAIGVVDTGLDLTHGDVRNADGTTRVEWFVDLGASPLGVHQAAEDLCAAARITCAVYGRAEIDQALLAGTPLPPDALGHGTHVTSIAASNGLSTAPPEYVGVAPEASLVVARASVGASITDVDVLAAVRILYFLVEDYGRQLGRPVLPMVMNLSLGSDFGPHDGSSALGAGLAALVGDAHPGRVIVTAAGNSGGVYLSAETEYPNPLGIHGNVHVAGSSRVPILTPPVRGAGPIEGQVFVWIEMGEGEPLSIGFDRGSRRVLGPVPPGRVAGRVEGRLSVTIVNGARDQLPLLPASRPGAVVIVDGSWAAEEVFALQFEGSGTAEIWVQSGGGIGPEVSLGALLPSATKEGTVNIPAAHPELIAVGATLNRLDWVDIDGEVRGSLVNDFSTPRVDSTVFFSSAGPNVEGWIKPDLVAPGALVIAAMSTMANPFENPASIFSVAACSPSPACGVVDPAHAISSGSSMAAPVVAGAVALLLERDPTLTQREVRRLLQSGARPLGGNVRLEQQVGAGALDLERTLQAHTEGGAPAGRTPGRASRMILARSYAEPDPTRPLRGLVQLRDPEGNVADGFDARTLRLEATPVTGAPELRREAPGLWSFSVGVPAGTAGDTLSLRVLHAGRVVAEDAVPIAVDANVARRGFLARGGCGVARRSDGPVRVTTAALLMVLGLARRRRLRGTRERAGSRAMPG